MLAARGDVLVDDYWPYSGESVGRIGRPSLNHMVDVSETVRCACFDSELQGNWRTRKPQTARTITHHPATLEVHALGTAARALRIVPPKGAHVCPQCHRVTTKLK